MGKHERQDRKVKLIRKKEKKWLPSSDSPWEISDSVSAMKASEEPGQALHWQGLTTTHGYELWTSLDLLEGLRPGSTNMASCLISSSHGYSIKSQSTLWRAWKGSANAGSFPGYMVCRGCTSRCISVLSSEATIKDMANFSETIMPHNHWH